MFDLKSVLAVTMRGKSQCERAAVLAALLGTPQVRDGRVPALTAAVTELAHEFCLEIAGITADEASVATSSRSSAIGCQRQAE